MVKCHKYHTEWNKLFPENLKNNTKEPRELTKQWDRWEYIHMCPTELAENSKAKNSVEVISASACAGLSVF